MGAAMTIVADGLQDKKVCPTCGSKRAKAVQRENQFGEGLAMMFVPDQQCKDCDTRYTVRPSRWQKALLPLVAGAGITLFGLMLILEPAWKLTYLGYFVTFLGGPCFFLLGLFILIKNPSVEDGSDPS